MKMRLLKACDSILYRF